MHVFDAFKRARAGLRRAAIATAVVSAGLLAGAAGAGTAAAACGTGAAPASSLTDSWKLEGGTDVCTRATTDATGKVIANPLAYGRAYHLYRNGTAPNGTPAADVAPAKVADRYTLKPSGGSSSALESMVWWKDPPAGASIPQTGVAAMIVLHGGGWMQNRGSAVDARSWAAYWARRGFMAFTPQYSLVPEAPQSPIAGVPDGNETQAAAASMGGPLDQRLTGDWVANQFQRGNCVGRGSVDTKIKYLNGLWTPWGTIYANWVWNSTCAVSPNTTPRSGPVGFNAVATEAQRDIQTLVRAIRRNAASLNVNPNHIYVMGESAGAVTAVRLALRSTSAAKSAAEFPSSLTAAQATAAANSDLTRRQAPGVPSTGVSSEITAAFSIAGTDCGRPNDNGIVTPAGVPGSSYFFGPTPPLTAAPGEKCVFSDGTTADDKPFTMFHGGSDGTVKVDYAQALCAQTTKCVALHRYNESGAAQYCGVSQSPLTEWTNARIFGNNAPGADHFIGNPGRCPRTAGITGGGTPVDSPRSVGGTRVDIAHRIEQALQQAPRGTWPGQ